jgi:hypothetical protein
MPHRRHRRHSAALPLLFALMLLLPSANGPARAQGGGLPWRDKGTPFGVVGSLGNRVRGDELGAAVQLLREAGVQWQREEIFWHAVQQQPGGAYNWNGDGSGFYDYERSIGAQVGAGIRVLGLLDYNPAWFKGKNPHPDEWIDAWGDFVYSAVAHFGRDRGWVKHWELWNEPNLLRSGYESGLYEVSDFARLLAVGRAAAKAADPEATIVLGGLASIWDATPSRYNYDYLDYLARLGELGAWSSFDIVAIHPYRPDAPEGIPWRGDRGADISTELSMLDRLLEKYGPKPVWLTEMGWHSSTAPYGVDPDTQAFFLVRSHVLALSHPSVEKIFWYTLRDDTNPAVPYEEPRIRRADPEQNYGLLRRTFPLDPNRGDLRKPAMLAYRTLTSMLAGLALAEVPADGRKPGLEDVYHYRFAGSGRRVDVLWRTGAQAATLTIPCGCREALVRTWGGQLARLLHSDNGSVTVGLDSLGAPLYVEYDPPVTPGGQRFAATGHTLRGAFGAYWEANGGLERFGYPLTEELIEPEAGTGRPRVVQYFERNRFEHFPEWSGSIHEVQLGRLGDDALRRQGVAWETQPRLEAASPECLLFPETGHSLCPPFRAYWDANGGLALLGYPLIEPAQATRPDTGNPYTVQYFERARLEHFPEHAGTRYEVQMGLLGRELLVGR